MNAASIGAGDDDEIGIALRCDSKRESSQPSAPVQSGYLPERCPQALGHLLVFEVNPLQRPRPQIVEPSARRSEMPRQSQCRHHTSKGRVVACAVSWAASDEFRDRVSRPMSGERHCSLESARPKDRQSREADSLGHARNQRRKHPRKRKRPSRQGIAEFASRRGRGGYDILQPCLVSTETGIP